jgi:hypothetical protein
LLATVTTSATGGGAAFITIPETVGGSDYSFQVQGSTSGLGATVPFTVRPGASVMPSIGRVGTVVTATFRGYGAGESITVRWYDTPTSSTVMGTAVASSVGTAKLTFTVPEAVKDAHTIEGTGNQGGAAATTYKVTPAVLSSLGFGAVGSTTTLTITGFGAQEQLTVRWYDTTSSATDIVTLTANAKGSASYVLAVPHAISGSHKIEVVGATTPSKPLAFFTVTSSVSLSPATGPAGTTVTVTLRGYQANVNVDIRWYSTITAFTKVASVTTSATGDGTATFTVPSGQTVGNHKVEGYATTTFTRASATFTLQ